MDTEKNNKNYIIDRQNLFPCYSPVFKRFLEEEKAILHIDKKNNELTDKTCWYFIISEEFNNSLDEWRERKLQGNKFYKDRNIIK